VSIAPPLVIAGHQLERAVTILHDAVAGAGIAKDV